MKTVEWIVFAEALVTNLEIESSDVVRAQLDGRISGRRRRPAHDAVPRRRAPACKHNNEYEGLYDAHF